MEVESAVLPYCGERTPRRLAGMQACFEKKEKKWNIGPDSAVMAGRAIT